MLITTLSLFCFSCGVLSGCSISVWRACTTEIVQIKNNFKEEGRVREKGGNEDLVEERTQKNNPNHLYRSTSIFTATVER